MDAIILPPLQQDTGYYNNEGEIKFNPAIYEQRYAVVLKILSHPSYNPHIKKVVDFGCAEMRLLTLMKRVDGIDHIVEVDTDEVVLHMYQQRAAPLIIDYLLRENPLRIEVFKGSIDVSAECLRNIDAVVAIEIIEHLHPDVLENVPYNIFGFIQPKLAIFTTPNSDFNVLFTPLQNGFRHSDHKFEWSQQQFKDWALNICERFPNYCVKIFGVGDAPDNPDIGPVSQFALFVRKDILNLPLDAEIEQRPAETSPDKQYEEVYAVDFPVRHDDRTLDQKILDDATYYINRFRTYELYHDAERFIYQIPFQKILDNLDTVDVSSSELRRVLLDNGHIFEGDYLIMPEDDDDRMDRPWSDDSDYDLEVYEGDEDEDYNPDHLTNGHSVVAEDENADTVEEEEYWD